MVVAEGDETFVATAVVPPQQPRRRPLSLEQPQDALEKFGSQLTEFEKIELGLFERIYTIGTVRREN